MPLPATFVWKLVEPFLCGRAMEELARKNVDLLSIGSGFVNVGLESC
jgi:hypothetical protein